MLSWSAGVNAAARYLMLKLNKADREILQILKVVFLTKNINPLRSDDHMRLWIIRALFIISVISVAVRIVTTFGGQDVPSSMSAGLSAPIALFFGVLFLHINNESEHTSVIVFSLTWVSIVLSLYV